MDTSVSHNFISSQWVTNRKLQIDDIPKFEVRVSEVPIHFDGFLLEANFYVVDLDGLDAMLGRQWLQTIGRYTVDHDKMQLEFLQDDRQVILEAMPKSEPKLISAHRMETIMRHDDMEWATPCFISSKAI